jgi:hypothetical protein
LIDARQLFRQRVDFKPPNCVLLTRHCFGS